MFRRPLVFVSGLTLGDYLLWNWSLNGNHDVIALIAGLTLPPLAVVLLWMLVLTCARLLGYAARRPTKRSHSAAARRRSAALSATAEPAGPDAASSAQSRKLAA